MYLRWLFYATAVTNVPYGLGFLLIPETLASWYRKPQRDGSRHSTVLGATLVPLGYVAWIAARTGGSPLKLHLTRTTEFVAILTSS